MLNNHTRTALIEFFLSTMLHTESVIDSMDKDLLSKMGYISQHNQITDFGAIKADNILLKSYEESLDYKDFIVELIFSILYETEISSLVRGVGISDVDWYFVLHEFGKLNWATPDPTGIWKLTKNGKIERNNMQILYPKYKLLAYTERKAFLEKYKQDQLDIIELSNMSEVDKLDDLFLYEEEIKNYPKPVEELLKKGVELKY